MSVKEYFYLRCIGFLCGFVAGMCSWFLFRGIKESPCFMSGLTLRDDKREMVVIRNKVLVTFEASFDFTPSLFLLFLPPAHCSPLYLSLSLACSLFNSLWPSPGQAKPHPLSIPSSLSSPRLLSYLPPDKLSKAKPQFPSNDKKT